MAKFFNKEYKHAFPRGKVIWVKGSIDGNPHKKITTGKEYSRANMNWVEKNWDNLFREYYANLQAEQKRDAMLTLDEYADLSFAQNESSRRFYTTSGHKQKYEKFISPVLGHRKLDEIRVSDIKLWYGYLTKNVNSHKYATDIKAVLSTILTDAMEDEYTNRNVVKNTRFPKKSSFKNDGLNEIDPFTLDEVNTLIRNAKGQFQNILTFQFFTGSRPGEMIALKWEDVNFHSKTIHIRRTRQGIVNPETKKYELGPTKTGEKRTVDMLPVVEEALRDQFKKTGLKGEFVFLSQNGEPYMRPDGLGKRQWKSLLKICLMDYKIFYQTRHTFASMFLSEGEDLAWISKVMLGHATIQTTLKYYAKFIKQNNVVRGAFLAKKWTKSEQSDNLVSESA